MRWAQGEAEVEGFLRDGELKRVSGGAANGAPMLTKARDTLATARLVVETDPDSAFILGYDAARHALVALLIQQGLRPTQKGGHLVVEHAIRAQFGVGFGGFGALRRRRNELEYPDYPDEQFEAALQQYYRAT